MTRVCGFFFFHCYLTTSTNNSTSSNFTGLLFYAYLCWDSPGEKTGLWHLPIVSSVSKHVSCKIKLLVNLSYKLFLDHFENLNSFRVLFKNITVFSRYWSLTSGIFMLSCNPPIAYYFARHDTNLHTLLKRKKPRKSQTRRHYCMYNETKIHNLQ